MASADHVRALSALSEQINLQSERHRQSDAALLSKESSFSILLYLASSRCYYQGGAGSYLPCLTNIVQDFL